MKNDELVLTNLDIGDFIGRLMQLSDERVKKKNLNVRNIYGNVYIYS